MGPAKISSAGKENSGSSMPPLIGVKATLLDMHSQLVKLQMQVGLADWDYDQDLSRVVQIPATEIYRDNRMAEKWGCL